MIRPLGDRILVKPKEADEKSAGGIYIPDAAQEKPAEGVVVSVGSKVDIDIEDGDIVMYGKYAGTEIESDGEKYLVIKDYDIMVVVIP